MSSRLDAGCVRWCMFGVSLGLGAAFVLAACGGSSSSNGSTTAPVDGSCTMHQKMSLGNGQTFDYQFCIEAVGLSSQQIEQLQQTCSSNVSLPDAGITQTTSFSRAACSRQNVIGGCKITAAGVTETIWYYQNASGSFSADMVQQICVQEGGTPMSASGQPVVVKDAGAD